MRTPYSQFATAYNRENIKAILKDKDIEDSFMGKFFGARPEAIRLYTNWRWTEMVRIATVQDAAQLKLLNNEFNGEGETTLDNIKTSLAGNKQEIVVVDEDNGELTGFVCVQLKKSFCYDDYRPEITEVYVKLQHRRNGIARAMILFAEEYCKKHYPLHTFELLTGSENIVAQTAYKNFGYCEDDEIHMAKDL